MISNALVVIMLDTNNLLIISFSSARHSKDVSCYAFCQLLRSRTGLVKVLSCSQISSLIL